MTRGEELFGERLKTGTDEMILSAISTHVAKYENA